MPRKQSQAAKYAQPQLKNQAFFQVLEKSEEARAQVISLMRFQAPKPWRGNDCTPAGSPIERVVKSFQKETNLPLDLPFFSFLFYLAGYLKERNAMVEFGGKPRGVQSWTIVLAPSGCGKTFSSSIVGDAAQEVLGIKADFPSCDSGAALFDSLLQYSTAGEVKNWLWDELAQKLKMIEQPGSPLATAKEILLKCYDGKPISRKTMKTGEIFVDDPSLNILGLNTDESFFKNISPESLTDGFAQRFSYVIAERDPSRHATDFPIYDEKALGEECRAAFQAIARIPIHPVYRCTPEAEASFKNDFKALFTEAIPESFFRRVMFLSFKYALYYHIILGKESSELDSADLAWALRLCALHIQDAAKMLMNTSSDIARLFQAGERVFDRCGSTGKPFTARELITNVWGLKSAADARGLYQLILDAKGVPAPTSQPKPSKPRSRKASAQAAETPAPHAETSPKVGSFRPQIAAQISQPEAAQR